MGNFNKFNGGGGGNMQQLMRQAQKMQEDMLKAQQELAETEVIGTAAGGMVEVCMTCDKTMTAVHIKPEAVDPEDVEMLEDMIVAAYNEAVKKADEKTAEVMPVGLGGMGF